MTNKTPAPQSSDERTGGKWRRFERNEVIAACAVWTISIAALTAWGVARIYS